MTDDERGPSWVLDAAVSEKIMESARIDPYSTNIALAWDVVQEMQRRGYRVEVTLFEPRPDNDKKAKTVISETDKPPHLCHHFYGWGLSASEAICLAALRAIDAYARVLAEEKT